MSDEDKTTINKNVDETIEWLDNNQQCEVDEYEHKLKELEQTVNPIMQKMYGAGGGGGMPGGMPDMGGAGGMPDMGGMGGDAAAGGGGGGPTIEEVD